MSQTVELADVTLEQVETTARRLPPAQQLKLVARLSERLSETLPAPHNGAQTEETQPNRPWLTGMDKAPMRRAFDELYKRMGIDDMEPIGAVKLQEMMIAKGIKPEDNILSRGIIEMREE